MWVRSSRELAFSIQASGTKRKYEVEDEWKTDAAG